MSRIDDAVKFARCALAEVGRPESLVYARDGARNVAVALDDADAHKAGCLAVLRLYGPDSRVRCLAHRMSECDRIPVAWALLGHTCGRAEGDAA